MIWPRRKTARAVPEGAVGVGPAAAPISTDGPLISVRQLERYYEAGGTRTYVLRNITLDIASGDFVSIELFTEGYARQLVRWDFCSGATTQEHWHRLVAYSY